jgi:hypothetical protein
VATKRKRRITLIRAADSNTVDVEGFIAPDTRGFDNLVRVRERSAFEIAVEELKAKRLQPMTAVLVWDETGGRKGSGPGIWATEGSLTVAFVLPPQGVDAESVQRRAAAAAVRVIERLVPKKKVAAEPDRLTLEGKTVGRVVVKKLARGVVVYVGIHSRTELAKAPRAVADECTTLVEHGKRLPTEWQIYQRLADAIGEELVSTP